MSLSTHQRIRRALAEKKKGVELEQAVQIPDFKEMKMAELKEYASVNGIDISGLNKKDDVIQRILEAVNKTPDPGDNGADDNGGTDGNNNSPASDGSNPLDTGGEPAPDKEADTNADPNAGTT